MKDQRYYGNLKLNMHTMYLQLLILAFMYIQPVTLSLPNLLTVPVNTNSSQKIESSLLIKIYFTRSLTKWELKHTKIEHCINTLHSPLLLPPHEVMNVGPHAAGEGSETQLNNSTYIEKYI